MVVLILESVPTGLRGELSKWMLEPKAGVFVGTVSGAVRDLLWEKACQEVGEGGCTMIYRAPNEQGFAIRSYGDTTRQVEEWEGLFLVRRPVDRPAAPPPTLDWAEMLHLELWAKTPRAEAGPQAGKPWYHPLICHLIDSAMVALRLWQYALPPALKEQVRSGLGAANIDEAGRWVAYFAGLHDLGKATPVFEKQWENYWPKLSKAGYRPARYSDKWPHHVLSAYLLKPLLEKQQIPPATAEAVARVAGGHHGLFPAAGAVEKSEPYAGTGQWQPAQANLVRVLAHVLAVDQLPPPPGDVAGQKGLLLILAGLTSVADWIASDVHCFPYAGDAIHLPTYATRARWRAKLALRNLGWFQRPEALDPATFQELFDKVPNRLQEQVLAVAPELDGPSLVLLEYPMGGGKTEGALYLADYLAATAGQRGAYFALPTMATSNQMFGRVGTYLRNRFPDGRTNVQLLHGHADLFAEFQLLQRAAESGRKRPSPFIDPSGVNGGKGAALVAAEWFTYRKRGLLAPYGIGTIDQVLLAVLQTKHFFVRLFGLAGKVVIVDEVHAYDTYMQTLLGHLLTWLAACGASVVLLSATLPAQTRQKLLADYATGRGRALPEADVAVAYPRISWVTEGGSGARRIDDAPERSVVLRAFGQTDGTWMDEMKAALAEGGCAAVILNTVTRAQAVYQELQAYFAPEELYLFHARYPFDERMEREQAVLSRFGPGGADRPQRAVVVATQVIEQSLDLDFDLMVTDLAPVDLLLQRSGRIWRHPRPWRPHGQAAPSLWLLLPPTDDSGRPVFEKGAARVYDPHTLLRTWLTVANLSSLVIPGAVEALVEAVYGDKAPRADLSEPIRSMWQETAGQLDRSEETAEGKARRRYIPALSDDLFAMGMEPLEEEREDLHPALQAATRLGGPSVSVVCLLDDSDGQLWASGPSGRLPISLERRPDEGELRALLGRSLRISFAPGLVRRIQDEVVPPGWEGTTHLRQHRALVFAPEGTCLTAGLPLRLDPDLGLMYVSHREEEEM